jgi:hypothetical protein
MRGAERPGMVKWTRPFLPPLEPISTLASRQTIVDIADEPMANEEGPLAELLELAGNLPLAVTLMAHVASFEGYLATLARWKAENTALLSEGYDKRSNLDKSIALSLTSPRMKSNAEALSLLSLLSLLPDGILVDELMSSNVPLSKIHQSRAALLQTSLAFIVDGRLKALPPIRDYVRGAHPASMHLTRPLRAHFQRLLTMWDSYHTLLPSNVLPQLISHLGNIHGLLLNAVATEGSMESDIGFAILTLCKLSSAMLKGESLLIEHVPHIVDASHDRRLHWLYMRHCAGLSNRSIPSADVEALESEGIQYFVQSDDYEAQGTYFRCSQKSNSDLACRSCNLRYTFSLLPAGWEASKSSGI